MVHTRRRVLALPALALATLAAAPWPKQPPLRRYEARVLVTGTDTRSRPAGLAACLRDVLVQVSGNPTWARDPRVAAAAPDPQALVADYDYVDRMALISHHDEQGSSDRPYWLTARFDPARLDALLARLGDAPWTGPRPTLFPLILVTGPSRSYPLTTDAPEAEDQRDALTEAANRYDLPLALPTATEFARGAPAGGSRMGVTGTLAWSDAAHGWIGTFARNPGPGETWTVRGVSYDEAFRVLVRGAAALASGHAAALSSAALPP